MAEDTRTAVIIQLLHDLSDDLANGLNGLYIVFGLAVIFLQILKRESYFE